MWPNGVLCLVVAVVVRDFRRPRTLSHGTAMGLKVPSTMPGRMNSTILPPVMDSGVGELVDMWGGRF